jgi:hypothetical protein
VRSAKSAKRADYTTIKVVEIKGKRTFIGFSDIESKLTNIEEPLSRARIDRFEMGTQRKYPKMKCESALRPIGWRPIQSAAISHTMRISTLHRIDCER